MTRLIELPIVVCGELVYPRDASGETIDLEYAHGVTVRLPRLTDEHLGRVIANREPLHGLEFAEVTRYLNAVAPSCLDAGHAITRQAIESASEVTGLSREMLARDWWIIGDFLNFRNNFYDLLDVELGTHRILDEWVVNHVARLSAFPRGRAFHVLVGNVPMAGIYSVIRSLLTRNQTIVKLPARDPVTCLQFARLLVEANPGHPLTRGLTVGYLEHDAPAFARLLGASDLVCAWGQGSSLQAIKHQMPHSVPYLEFGPKRSLEIVYADEVDPDSAALRVAHDLTVYDQEACFSPQRLFVVGDHHPLMEALGRWLAQHDRFLPKGTATADIDSHVLRVRLEARFRGWEVVEGGAWTLIVSPDPYAPVEHPLSRTLLVHPIDSIDEVMPLLDDETQTVAVLPFDSRARDVAESACPRGAVRVCEGGLVSHFRQGFTHDGAYILPQFVRLACLERSLAYTYKYGPVRDLPELEQAFFGATTNGADHVVR